MLAGAGFVVTQPPRFKQSTMNKIKNLTTSTSDTGVFLKVPTTYTNKHNPDNKLKWLSETIA